MGAVDDLVRAREAYDRRDWVTAYDELSAVDPTHMDPGAFAALATVAYLLGRKNDCVQALQRAYRAHVDAGDVLGAVRCAFWLARTLMMGGEPAVSSGWAAKAQRLLDERPDDVVEAGYVRILEMFQHIFWASSAPPWTSPQRLSNTVAGSATLIWSPWDSRLRAGCSSTAAAVRGQEGRHRSVCWCRRMGRWLVSGGCHQSCRYGMCRRLLVVVRADCQGRREGRMLGPGAGVQNAKYDALASVGCTAQLRV